MSALAGNVYLFPGLWVVVVVVVGPVRLNTTHVSRPFVFGRTPLPAALLASAIFNHRDPDDRWTSDRACRFFSIDRIYMSSRRSPAARVTKSRKMSKLSSSLKALIAAPHARPNTLPSTPQIRSVYERIRNEAAAKNVGVPAWLALSVSECV